MKIVIGFFLVFVCLTRVNAAEPSEDTLRYPTTLWWPGSLDNAISILEGDATRINPPYHLEKSEPWNVTSREGKVNKGYHLVFTRPDHIIEFHVSEANKKDCEMVLIQKHGWTPEDWRRAQNDPHNAPAVDTP
jgi:hypothetical protein